MGIFFRTKGRRLGLQGFEFRVMGVMTACAEKISSLARSCEVSHPFPMDTGFPILILRPVTFAAKPVAFCEVKQVSIVEPQFIPILRIMTIQTPSHRFSMMEFDIGMFFL
jgi:hypothetical protein